MKMTPLNSRLPTLAVGILLWSAEAAPLRLAAEPIHVVLANGNVIHGELSRDGKDYVVRDGGATLHLRENEVACVCHDLAEAYLHFVKSLDRGDWDGRLRLVGWCMSHGLLDQAAWDLDRLEREHPQDARIASLRRRLEVERTGHQSSLDDTTGTLATERALPGPAMSSAMVSRQRSSFARDAQHVPSLSREAMERYTRRIQPLLLNVCGAAGCHGSARASFRIRSPKRAGALGHATASNLREVLARLAPNGENSALLRAHTSELGGPSVGLLTPSQQAELLQWIDLVYSPEKEQEGDSREPGRSPGSTLRENTVDFLEDLRPTQTPSTGSASPSPPWNNKRVDWSEGPGTDEGPTFTPRDPFDPEIFNRRYFPERFP